MDHYTPASPAPSSIWDQRYAEEEYTYGTLPNEFFQAELARLQPGTLLVPGAGQGRDAVYAAEKGWKVYCTDQSNVGCQRAIELAENRGVKIQYIVCDILAAQYPEASFDLIACIFFHLLGTLRRQFFTDAQRWLKPGGTMLIQSFTPAQLSNTSGGPKDVDMLATPEILQSELAGLEVIL